MDANKEAGFKRQNDVAGFWKKDMGRILTRGGNFVITSFGDGIENEGTSEEIGMNANFKRQNYFAPSACGQPSIRPLRACNPVLARSMTNRSIKGNA